MIWSLHISICRCGYGKFKFLRLIIYVLYILRLVFGSINSKLGRTLNRSLTFVFIYRIKKNKRNILNKQNSKYIN